MSEKITLEYGLTQHFTVTAEDPGDDEHLTRIFRVILANKPLLNAICEREALLAMEDGDSYVKEWFGNSDFNLLDILFQFIDCFTEEDKKSIRAWHVDTDSEGYFTMEDWFTAKPSGFHVNEYKKHHERQ